MTSLGGGNVTFYVKYTNDLSALPQATGTGSRRQNLVSKKISTNFFQFKFFLHNVLQASIVRVFISKYTFFLYALLLKLKTHNYFTTKKETFS